MRAWVAGTFAAVVCAGTGCAAALPPSGWEHGGAPLGMPHARWVLGDVAIDVEPSGRVLIDGTPELGLDAAGRVYDREQNPLAMLLPDGTLLGPDDEPLGTVGARHASLPGDPHAWLSLAPSGEVIRYEPDGSRRPFGVWRGCGVDPRTRQACTLVTHVLGSRLRRAGSGGTLSFGLGVGVGLPLR